MKLANPPERWLCLDGGWNSPCRQNVFCAGNFSPCPAYMNDGELLTPFWSLAALSPWCISLSLTLMYQTGSLTAPLGWLNKAPLNPHFPIVSWLDFSFLSSLTRPLPSGSTLSAGHCFLWSPRLAARLLGSASITSGGAGILQTRDRSCWWPKHPVLHPSVSPSILASAWDKLQLPNYSLLL